MIEVRRNSDNTYAVYVIDEESGQVQTSVSADNIYEVVEILKYIEFYEQENKNK